MICPLRLADNWAHAPAGRSISKAAVSGANVPVPGIVSGCDDAANAWIASAEGTRSVPVGTRYSRLT